MHCDKRLRHATKVILTTMINRILIRIKVVQMLYNYMLTRDVKSLAMARDELQQSFDKSYELYKTFCDNRCCIEVSNTAKSHSSFC